MRIEIIEGDITTLAVDAIVNAANESLLGGGGVDGAIHRAAGPGLLEECRQFGGCPTGQAKITTGHLLPARYVIHTVGPVWHGGNRGEGGLLTSCYWESLALAMIFRARTIAFPAISCGAYGFPLEQACRIAVSVIEGYRAVAERVRDPRALECVTFVAFDSIVADAYRQALRTSEAGDERLEP